jgi:hypothetical protein
MAYKPNVDQNPPNRERLSDGWFNCFGFRLPSSEICCDGCMADDPTLIDRGCPVRPCVMEKGLDNCSQCTEYVCDKLKQRQVIYEEIRQRFGEEISAEDRTSFIRPYENRWRPDALRSSQSDSTG